MQRRRSRSEARAPGSFAGGAGNVQDPLAGVGGAAPARSALTLRAVLAVFGLVFCSASAAVAYGFGLELWVVAVFVVLAVAALVDLVVILRRKHRGEPG